MALPALPSVHHPCVALVRDRQSFREAVDGSRAQYEVYMVRHEAPCQHFDIGIAATFRDEIDVACVVGDLEERLLTPVTTLGDVVGYAWNDDASCAWHPQLVS